MLLILTRTEQGWLELPTSASGLCTGAIITIRIVWMSMKTYPSGLRQKDEVMSRLFLGGKKVGTLVIRLKMTATRPDM